MTQGPPDWGDRPVPMVVVMRFEVSGAAGADFRERARVAVEVLAAQRGFVSGAVDMTVGLIDELKASHRKS